MRDVIKDHGGEHFWYDFVNQDRHNEYLSRQKEYCKWELLAIKAEESEAITEILRIRLYAKRLRFLSDWLIGNLEVDTDD